MTILTREHLNALARQANLTTYGQMIAKERDAERNEDEMARKSITLRTAERLVRAAYDYEELATRLRSEGHESHADGLKDVSRKLGDMGRSLERKLEGKE